MLGFTPGNRGGSPLTLTDLNTPLGDEVLDLVAGDRVRLSGIVFTARDEAHQAMQEIGIPFNPAGAAIYHCGPIIQDNKVIAAGPTTSARMNRCSGFLLDGGVKALIGKGGMGPVVRDQLLGRGIYLAFTGGCAALAASRMTVGGVYFPELGMAEAVWVLNFDKVPLVVGIDARGNDLFWEVARKAKLEFSATFT